MSTPLRNVSQDANEGVVYPPKPQARRRVEATPTQQKQVSNTDLAVDQVGSNLGNALTKYLSSEADNINEQRTMDATIRQGEATAINEIDETKKRTGFDKFIFGENIDYRAAQQGAVQNSIREKALKMSTEIDEYAHEDPVMFAKRLKGDDGLDGIIAPYMDDPETKRMAATIWATESKKLAEKHYKSHYAYTQVQARETYRQQVRLEQDQIAMDADELPEGMSVERREHLEDAWWNGSTRPSSMNQAAWSSLVSEEVNHSLKEGNLHFYKAGKKRGFYKNYSDAQLKELNSALAEYDRKEENRINIVQQQFITMVEDARNKGKYDPAAIINTNAEIRKMINEMEVRLPESASGTVRSKEIIAEKQAQLSRMLQNIKEEDAKAANKARGRQIAIAAFGQPWKQQGAAIAGAVKDHNLSNSDLKDAYDKYILTMVEDYLGANPNTLDTNGGALEIMSNPDLAEHISRTWSTGSPQQGEVLGILLNNMLNAQETMMADGQPTNEALVAIDSLNRFYEKNPEKFNNAVGASQQDKFIMFRRAINGRHTVQQYREDLRKYEENKGDSSTWKSTYPTAEGETQRQYVQKIVSGVIGEFPTDKELSNAMENYSNGLIINGGDHSLARDYLQNTLRAASIDYAGQTLYQADYMKEIGDYDFDTFMNLATESNVEGRSAMTAILTAMTGSEKNQAGKFWSVDDIAGLEYFVPANKSGLGIRAQSGKLPIVVSNETLGELAKYLKEVQRQEALIKEKDIWLLLDGKIDIGAF